MQYKTYIPSYHDIFLYDLVDNPYNVDGNNGNGSTHRPIAFNTNNPLFGKANFTCLTNDYRKVTRYNNELYLAVPGNIQDLANDCPNIFNPPGNINDININFPISFNVQGVLITPKHFITSSHYISEIPNSNIIPDVDTNRRFITLNNEIIIKNDVKKVYDFAIGLVGGENFNDLRIVEFETALPSTIKPCNRFLTTCPIINKNGEYIDENSDGVLLIVDGQKMLTRAYYNGTSTDNRPTQFPINELYETLNNDVCPEFSAYPFPAYYTAGQTNTPVFYLDANNRLYLVRTVGKLQRAITSKQKQTLEDVIAFYNSENPNEQYELIFKTFEEVQAETAIVSSSALVYFSENLTGAIGNTGATGPTGLTGATGPLLVGNIGPTGAGICGASSPSAYTLRLQITGTGPVDVNIKGATSAYDSQTARLLGETLQGYSVIFHPTVSEAAENISDVSKDEYLLIKGISFNSSTNLIESVTDNGNQIIIRGKTFNQAPAGICGNIVYVDTTTKAKGVVDSNYDNKLSLLDLPLSAERIVLVNNKNIDDALGAYSQNISGYSGACGGAYPVYDFSNDISNNISSGRYEATFSENIISLTPKLDLGVSGSVDLLTQFQTIRYNRGYSFTPQIITDEDIGSCCFCELGETESDIKCQDYISRQYCLDFGGSFSLKSCKERIISTTDSCFNEGACCLNGKCVNTSQNYCLKYGGIFYPGEICNNTEGSSEYFTCASSCNVQDTLILGKCCVEGKCFNNFTKAQCDSFLFSTHYANEACNADCDTDCKGSSKGGCCINGQITLTFADQCAGQGGIFLGAGIENGFCCGNETDRSYFNGLTACRATINIPCFPIGTKIGGGYLIGIIGEPSPCTTFGNPLKAIGQCLPCRYYPRGLVQGESSQTWAYKNCFGDSGSTAISSNEFFIRSYPENLPLDSKSTDCLFKSGPNFVQQTTSGIQRLTPTTQTNLLSWPIDSKYFNTSATNGKFAYSHESISTVVLFEGLGLANSDTYRSLANQFYGSLGIPVSWALIVSPEDIDIGTNDNLVKWGMCEGRVRNVQDIGEKYNLEPISTCPVDGLLTTRMHDETSKDNTFFWFRGQSVDTKAFDRFNFYNAETTDKTNWNNTVDEYSIEHDKNQFKMKYSDMWDSSNPVDSCTKQISVFNEIASYGYNDWYIPSIIELNYIMGNLDDLNTSILINGDKILESNMDYWSSTSLCTLLNWNNNNHTSESSYNIAEEPNLEFNSKFRFTSSDFPTLTQKDLYSLSMNVCAGENMLVQNTADFKVKSASRNQKLAKLRPVRRIPIVKIPCNLAYSITDAYTNYDYNTCLSCSNGCV